MILISFVEQCITLRYVRNRWSTISMKLSIPLLRIHIFRTTVAHISRAFAFIWVVFSVLIWSAVHTMVNRIIKLKFEFLEILQQVCLTGMRACVLHNFVNSIFIAPSRRDFLGCFLVSLFISIREWTMLTILFAATCNVFFCCYVCLGKLAWAVILERTFQIKKSKNVCRKHFWPQTRNFWHWLRSNNRYAAAVCICSTYSKVERHAWCALKVFMCTCFLLLFWSARMSMFEGVSTCYFDTQLDSNRILSYAPFLISLSTWLRWNRKVWRDGTTAIAVLLVDDTLYVSNIGDCKVCVHSDTV